MPIYFFTRIYMRFTLPSIKVVLMKKFFSGPLMASFSAIFLMSVALPQAATINPDTIAARLKAMTGKSHVKVVYTRDSVGIQEDFPAYGDFTTDQVLVGFDSDSAKEDTLQTFLSNYQNPLISHDGNRIVYTRIRGTQNNADSMYTYVIDWKKNAAPRKVANGLTGCLWFDSVNNKEYVIYSPLISGGNVYKRDLDDTMSDTMLLSEYKPITQWLRISKDGKCLASCFGGFSGGTAAFYVIGPKDSILATDNGGCCPSMPYDNTYRLVMTTTNHNAWNVTAPDGSGGLANFTNIGHFSQMRMASYSTNIFLAVVNAVDGDNGTGDIRIIKTDDSLKNVLSAITITPNDWSNNHYPDLWAGGTTTAVVPPHSQLKIPARTTGPAKGSNFDIFTVNGRRISSGNIFMQRGRAGLPAGLYISVNRNNARVERFFSTVK